ncbi:MAG: hypothetical protein E6I66_08480 [Chloroflexi bacterium]|nr:MAG: hypothetical protein E6I66_08480 [Chloroflexota bacterium]
MRVSSAKLRRFVLRVLRQTPIPPRPVSYGAVLGTVLRSTLGLIAALFGVGGVVAGLVAVVSAHGQMWAYLFGVWFLVFGALVIIIPFWYSMRVRRALADGLLVDASVVRLETAEGPNRRTMDAMGNGSAGGLRNVHHPLGNFEERFEFDGPGASGLQVGSRLSVLIDPARKRVLLTVGVEEQAAA